MQFGNADGFAESIAAQLKSLDDDAAGEWLLSRSLGLGKTAIGNTNRFFQRGIGRRCWVGGAGRVSDFSARRSAGLQAGSQVAAHCAQGVQSDGCGDPVQLDGEARQAALASPLAGQVSSEANVAVTQRGVADQVVDGAAGDVGGKAAVGVKVHGLGRGELGAMNAGRAQPGFDLGRLGRAVQLEVAGKIAAPARIGAEQQAGELAQLRLVPLQVDMHRHLAQCGSLVQIRLQAHDPRAGLFETDVGANGFAAQPDAPLARIRLPQRDSGADD